MRFQFLLVLFFPFSVQAQSPWPRSKAGFYVQAAWNFIPAYDEVFEGKNVATPLLDREVAEHSFQLYGEYGLTRRTTLVAAVPVRFLRSGDFIPSNYGIPETREGNLTGLGNVSLGVRQAICEGLLRLTGTLRVDLPTQRYDDATGLRTGYNAWTVLPLLGTGMGRRRAYWFVYGGYGLRSNDYSHFLNGGAEAGWHLKKLWLIGFSEVVYALENGNIQLPLHNRIKSLYVNNQGYWSLGLKTIFELNRFWGITASAAGAGWGQYVPKRPGFGLGTYFKWD